MKLSDSLARAWDAFATKPAAPPPSTINAQPSTNQRPSIRDIIAGVKLPNTAEQSAMIKALGLQPVQPTIKIQSPFRAVAPFITIGGPEPTRVDEAPAELPEPRPAPRSTDGAERLVPFSSIRTWCDTKDAELATAHAHIAELENKLRWSLQRETALREELHAERTPPVHTSPSSP